MAFGKEQKQSYYQRKRAVAMFAAEYGMAPPAEWMRCEICGEWFPYFSSYIQTRTARSCPERFTGNPCGKMHRQTKAGRGHTPKQTYQTGQCRRELCNKKPFCIHISRCLDREIMRPGSLPLKPDGSCKVPNTGIDVESLRLRASGYGAGLAHTI